MVCRRLGHCVHPRRSQATPCCDSGRPSWSRCEPLSSTPGLIRHLLVPADNLARLDPCLDRQPRSTHVSAGSIGPSAAQAPTSSSITVVSLSLSNSSVPSLISTIRVSISTRNRGLGSAHWTVLSRARQRRRDFGDCLHCLDPLHLHRKPLSLQEARLQGGKMIF